MSNKRADSSKANIISVLLALRGWRDRVVVK